MSIVVEKTDRTTGKQLANHKDCIFKITPMGGATFADGSTTPIVGNDDELTAALRGNLLVSDTATGVTRYIYSIQEMQEPGGYQIEPQAVNFIIDKNGDVFALNGEGTIITSAEGTPDLSFSDPAIDAYFEKTNADGTMIDGATFTIDGTFADGSTSKAVSPTASAAASIDGQIVAGTTYTLTETAAPSGYVALTSPITFTVDSLGAITITSDPDSAASVGTDKATLIVKNTLAPAASTNKTVTPKTSDSSPYGLASFLGSLGMLALAGAGFERRRRRNNGRSKA